MSINPDTGKPYITPNGQRSGDHRADYKTTSDKEEGEMK